MENLIQRIKNFFASVFHIGKKIQATIYVILGGAYGDEGKGKVTAFYARIADLVIRATGGANAGHTVFINGKKVGLHLMPSGIMYNAICLIGQGVALDLGILLQEIEMLNPLVPDLLKRLKISGTATLVMPYHKTLDAANEALRNHQIGTTKKGIGPAYADEADRIALKVYDLFRPYNEIKGLLLQALKKHRPLLKEYGDSNMLDIEAYAESLTKELIAQAETIKPLVVDGQEFVDSFINDPTKTIVVEGAQGIRLSGKVGDYPNCTSSDSNIHGALSGAHINPSYQIEIIVVLKAYLSKVGNGAFPTEIDAHIDKNGKLIDYEAEHAYIGDIMRNFFHEYGVTTGRPRRVGWFDGVIAKTSVKVSGAIALCVNCLDSIGELGLMYDDDEPKIELKIATSYIYQGKKIEYFPRNIEQIKDELQPVYQTFKGGWKITPQMRTYNSLPKKAKEFLRVIEDITGAPVKYIGVGPRNEDIIVRK
ncbi:adenylosuccinate synthetase [bacterium]|nr:adenylosuccinate synthetase [bacterium]